MYKCKPSQFSVTAVIYWKTETEWENLNDNVCNTCTKLAWQHMHDGETVCGRIAKSKVYHSIRRSKRVSSCTQRLFWSSINGLGHRLLSLVDASWNAEATWWNCGRGQEQDLSLDQERSSCLKHSTFVLIRHRKNAKKTEKTLRGIEMMQKGTRHTLYCMSTVTDC